MRKNMLRGELLEFLQTLYPQGVEENTLLSVFYQYHQTSEITTAINYCVDKKYAEKKEHPHPYKERESVSWFKITPKGIDLLEGSIESDPGITIPVKTR